ncbi:MAG: ATP-binding protein [Clostridia bacterium]|nr:ATP-binding protein [Clostridia bacterium]
MKTQEKGMETVVKLMFRLLPVQILLFMVGAVNGLVSSFFASNFIGANAMGAVGLYGPVDTLINAIRTLLAGGSAILCGKYMGRNDQEKVRNVFTLNMLLSAAVGVLFTVLLLVAGTLNLTGFFTRDEAVRPLFNAYLNGQAVGILPLVMGNQLPVYLSLENRQNLTMTASLIYIGVNIALNFLFVQVLRMEAFGLALASALGLWVFFGVQAVYFLPGKSKIRLEWKQISWKESTEILRTGFPGAAGSGYQTARGLIVNKLLVRFVGSVGISAFATANNLLSIFWAIPAGMQAVSRLMISISAGEEDLETLEDVMRNMFRRFVPIMCCISALLILCAEPFTRLFYRDSSDPVYMMTVWGFRILPLCMPLSIICMHFTCYGQAMGQNGFVNFLALIDGVVCVAVFSAILIRPLGINGVYVANVLNGICCFLVIIRYAWMKKKRFPCRVRDLMVVPEGFGVEADARIDITVQNMDEVLKVSRNVTDFCKRRGIDGRRAYMAGLCLEEMAGNIVAHGFTKDSKKHLIDIRVVHKKDLLLRIRDDCVPFNPKERNELTNGPDRFRNMGIKMVYKAARDVKYQSVLGMNVLTIRI